MAARLVNTTEELKAGLGAVWSDLQYDAIRSFVESAEDNFIVPAIGYAQYEALKADTLADKLQTAKGMLVRAIANFAIFNYTAFGAVQISEQGIMVLKDSRYMPASDKKVYLLRKQSRLEAYKALEAAINFMEANRAEFTPYIASTAHLANKQYYCNTTFDFSQGFELSGNSELFAAIKTVMRSVEERYIDPLLGATVSGALRTSILGGSLNTQQNTLLGKIVKAVAPLTIAEAIPYSLVSFENGQPVTNNLQSNTENIEASSPGTEQRLQAAMNSLLTVGQQKLGALTAWLNANPPDGYTYQDLNARNNINADGGGFYII